MSVPDKQRTTALVLAGGGALGAYEAGVLHYVLGALPAEAPELRRQPRFELFAGTSVGALNTSFLAAGAKDPAGAAAELASFWRQLTIEQVLRFGSNELALLLLLLIGAGSSKSILSSRQPPPRPHAGPHPPVAGLFDTTPLQQLMRGLVPWEQLNRNLEEGLVHGIAVCATEICTGKSMIFYQTSRQTDYRAGTDPIKQARQVRLRAEHALASAAMPFVFPAVQIDGVCYTDGALRQNTPLNPALRMGADKLLVVSLSQGPAIAARVARQGCRRNQFPGALFLLGKTVPIFITQSLDYELQRVQMYNKLLAGGAEAYGPGFAPELNRILGQHRNATYRTVATCHIRPSQDLSALAVQALQQAPHELRVPGLPGRVLSRLLRLPAFLESGLLGFIMFTPTFTRLLHDLGFRDAQAQRAELTRFFAD